MELRSSNKEKNKMNKIKAKIVKFLIKKSQLSVYIFNCRKCKSNRVTIKIIKQTLKREYMSYECYDCGYKHYWFEQGTKTTYNKYLMKKCKK